MSVILNLRQFKLVVQFMNTGAFSLCYGQLEDILFRARQYADRMDP
jgi:hypothetical protein